MPNSTDTKVNSFVINKTTEELLKTQPIEPNQIYITPDDSTSGEGSGSDLSLENSEFVSNIEGGVNDVWQTTKPNATIGIRSQEGDNGTAIIMDGRSIQTASVYNTNQAAVTLNDSYLDIDLSNENKSQSIEITAEHFKVNGKKVLVEGDVEGFKVEVVTTLPTINISNSTIYLVPNSTEEENNIYDEYVYASNNWELIGSTKVDLTNVVDLTSEQTIPGIKTIGDILKFNKTLRISSPTHSAMSIGTGNELNNCIGIGYNLSHPINCSEDILIGHYMLLGDANSRPLKTKYSIVIGTRTPQGGNGGVMYNYTSTGSNSIAIGRNAFFTANNAIQFGEGINTTNGSTNSSVTENHPSFQVGSDLLLLNGKIPIERLPDGIQIDTSNFVRYEETTDVEPEVNPFDNYYTKAQQDEKFDLKADKSVVSNLSNPNILINGDFRINQRGLTSYTSSSSSPVYTVDRFRFNLLGENPSALTVKENCVNVSFSNIYARLEQTVEDYQIYAGKTVTLSASLDNIVGEVYLQVSYADGQGIYSQPITTSGIHSIVVNVPENISWIRAMVQKRDENGVTVSCDIHWMKLELGSIATPFIPRTYAEELAMCQRYCIVDNNLGYKYIQFGSGQASSTTIVPIKISIPVTLRVLPTILYQSNLGLPTNELPSTLKLLSYSSGAITIKATTAMGVSRLTTGELLIDVSSTGLTVGHMYSIYVNNDSLRLIYDAEIY